MSAGVQHDPAWRASSAALRVALLMCLLMGLTMAGGCAGPAERLLRAEDAARTADAAYARADWRAALSGYQTALSTVDTLRQRYPDSEVVIGLHAGTTRIGEQPLALLRHERVPELRLRVAAQRDPMAAAHLIARYIDNPSARVAALSRLVTGYVERRETASAERAITDLLQAAAAATVDPPWRLVAEAFTRVGRRDQAMLALTAALAAHRVADWGALGSPTAVISAHTAIAYGLVDAGDLKLARRAVAVALRAAEALKGAGVMAKSARDEALRALARDCEIMGLHTESLETAKRIGELSLRLEPMARAAAGLGRESVLDAVAAQREKLAFGPRLELDTTLIGGYARVGRVETALALARKLGRPILRALWTAAVARHVSGEGATRRAGILQTATTLASALSAPAEQARALSEIARVSDVSGAPRAEVVELLTQAAGRVRAAPSRQILTGVKVAKGLVTAGEAANARALLRALVGSAAARSIGSPELLLVIAGGLLAADAPPDEVLALTTRAVTAAERVGGEALQSALKGATDLGLALERPQVALAWIRRIEDAETALQRQVAAGEVGPALIRAGRGTTRPERVARLLAIAAGLSPARAVAAEHRAALAAVTAVVSEAGRPGR